jgi:sec-independent protein translocase protein TatB
VLSPSDTAIVFVLALLLFGPEQLPKLARQLGEAMRNVQNTTHTFMQEMERAADTNEPHQHGMGDGHTHEPAESLARDTAEPATLEHVQLSRGQTPESSPQHDDLPDVM